ncbi:uncharacterized protein BP5553_01970 [Venustampulla echinocandica]|uniref:Endopolyphosphatase n=1 Tax=Venustampulla echinocandica TaxID=2656787 RepID=A0A370U2J0_9HELO|nr:uncharacterized protein BP5553_01970 [Venustampulla echinocandica]RDL41991.1 hypothetical protein BP5553_01970 [Venustampulla echinocandica]
MKCLAFFLAGWLLETSSASPPAQRKVLQDPLEGVKVADPRQASRRLHGKFLHITDLHPDPWYKTHSSADDDHACHRGKGPAGVYGMPTSDCDSPYALVNATFKWIEENIRDSIDFVIWTGDSARHDRDEQIPRSRDEVLNTNRWTVERFLETFSKADDPKNNLIIPVIPTFGNNDFLPHNIFRAGPNKWLDTYTEIWSEFIPEEQRHGFRNGGWYYVEVIPGKLAVFSLNTMYFFSNNAAVDGCSQHSEPGFQHFEWLRIQLQFMRERGMKAILSGHVAPARTEGKQMWDESCWQKYALWLQQYRDVVVGGLYGHMNIDHFMVQDTKEISILEEGKTSASLDMRATMDDELTINSARSYLEELRDHWSNIPDPKPIIDMQSDLEDSGKKKRGKKERERKKLLRKFGGLWCERFQVTNVGPSVVPNYFPTLRVIEYNITELGQAAVWSKEQQIPIAEEQMDWLDVNTDAAIPDQVDDQDDDIYFPELEGEDQSILKKKKKGKKGKKGKKKPKTPDFDLPSPPSKSSPPGPAYSPQTLTMLGYTQYFANLTYINNEPQAKQTNGKKSHPRPFQYEVEYDTFTDPVYKLKDMTVASYLKFAHKIGLYEPGKNDLVDEYDEPEADDSEDFDDDDDEDETDDEGVGSEKKKKKKKKKKHRKQRRNKAWLQFVKYAFVGTLDEDKLQSFDPGSDQEFWNGNSTTIELHDGEL